MHLATKMRRRLASDEGFTLIELLVVLVIIGILLAIAVPSYLGFKDRANKTAAQANLRAAVPSVEAFYADNGSYATGGTPPFNIGALQAIDAGLSTDVSIVSGAASTYCIKAVHGGFTYYKGGPSGTVTTTVCT